MTLVPTHCTESRIETEFNVNNNIARSSKLKTPGMLPLNQNKKGNKINQDIVDSVIEYYNNELAKIM